MTYQFIAAKKTLRRLLFIVAAFVFACTTGVNYASADERDIKADEIREFGIVLNIEDYGYPMHSVTMEFPERNIEHVFSLNAEGVDLGGVDLFGNTGRYATIYYESNIQNALLDMHVDGKTIFGEYGGLASENDTSITGILEGAYDVTAGDLPDALFVTSKAGKTIRFEFFISEEMVMLNETTVTAYFERRYSDDITYMRFAN